MPAKVLRVEPLSSSYWDILLPPVDQGLWKRYVNEEDSNSDMSDIEDGNSMAGPSNTSKPNTEQAVEGKAKSKGDLMKEVLDSTFNNMIYSILDGASVEEAAASKLEEKKTGTAIEAEKAKDSAAKEHRPPTGTSTTASKPAKPISDQFPKGTNSQEALSTLPTCPNCCLPRLLFPRIGMNSRPPPDPSARYCSNEPPVILLNHDVHGNAFLGFKPKPNTTAASAAAAAAATERPNAASASTSAKTTKGKSAKTEKKGQQASADASSPTSPTSSTSDTSTTIAAASSQSAPAEYPQIRTPQMKCPNNCGQWKTVNVMAKHLDSCLLGKGRKAGREARQRISREAGDSSRGGTPKPGGSNGGGGGGGLKRKGDGDGEKAGMGKKVKKGK